MYEPFMIRDDYRSFNLSVCNSDMDDVAKVYLSEPAVPTFEYKSGIDPKVIMILAVAGLVIMSVVFALGFRGVL